MESQARAGGLDKAAAQNGLNVVTTGYFSRNDLLPGIGQSPEFMARIEQVALRTKEGRERVAKLEKRIAMRRQMLKQAATRA